MDDQDVACNELMESASEWLRRVLEQKIGVDDVGELSPYMCSKGLLKDALGELLSDSLTFNSKQNDMLRDLRNGAAVMKKQIIDAQDTVIQLQKELLESKNQQLQMLQNTVKSSVAETVKAEFVTYSAAVQKNRPPSPALAPETLKSVVKKVAEEEDRSRSLMVFGLPEEGDEQLRDKVSAVFQEFGEKPRLEASRLGEKKENSTRVRPVRVTLYNTATAKQILAKTKALKKTARYSSVFITPDRSPEQREVHRQLVQELKRRTADKPTERHYISGGKVWSVEKAKDSLR